MVLRQSPSVYISNCNVDIPLWGFDQVHNMNTQFTFCCLEVQSINQTYYTEDETMHIILNSLITFH